MKFTSMDDQLNAMPILRAHSVNTSDVYVALESNPSFTPEFKIRKAAGRIYGGITTATPISATYVEGSVYLVTLPPLSTGAYVIEAYSGTMLLEALTIHVYDIDVKFHLANVGWVGSSVDSKGALYTDSLNRVEAMIINVQGLPDFIKLLAEGHSQDFGWLGEVGSGEVIGKPNMSKRLEAFRIRLFNTRTGQTVPNIISYNANTNPNDLPYSYIENHDGGYCGTTGLGLALYQIMVYLQ